MWEKDSVYPKMEAFKPHMNDIFVKDFINKTYNQNVNDSAILKIKIAILKFNTSRNSCERKTKKS